MKLILPLALIVWFAWSLGDLSLRAEELGRNSGLPLTRFVSVASDRANVRNGPGTDYGIRWTFVRRGLPVEIFQEFDNWRRIRDWEGKTGWMHVSLLSGERMAFIAPWRTRNVPLRPNPHDDDAVRAWLEPRVLVEVESCDGEQCQINVAGLNGYVTQISLWGVYPGEPIT